MSKQKPTEATPRPHSKTGRWDWHAQTERATAGGFVTVMRGFRRDSKTGQFVFSSNTSLPIKTIRVSSSARVVHQPTRPLDDTLEAAKDRYAVYFESLDESLVSTLGTLFASLDDRYFRADLDQLSKLVSDFALPEPKLARETQLSQAQRNAQAREAFIREYPVYESADIARLSDSTSENRHATATRWEKNGRIFSVKIKTRKYYPAFQFDQEGPKPVIAEVIRMANGEITGWPLALWFTTPNAWLDRQRPVDLLDKQPQAVIDAMEQAVAPVG